MMPRVMVDSNVLLDVFTEDPQWFAWSHKTLEEHLESDVLVINPVVYAEISVGFERVEDLDECLPPTMFAREAIPWEAAFLAAKCFVRYRRGGGRKTAPLPDFFIGAHAAVKGMPIITRDVKRYRTYFPTLRLIAP